MGVAGVSQHPGDIWSFHSDWEVLPTFSTQRYGCQGSCIDFGSKELLWPEECGELWDCLSLGCGAKNRSVSPSLSYAHSIHHEHLPRQWLLPSAWASD